MYNFNTKFTKILNLCKKLAGNLAKQLGNVPRCGVFTKFSDVEVIALAMTAEICDFDSENRLFHYLENNKNVQNKQPYLSASNQCS